MPLVGDGTATVFSAPFCTIGVRREELFGEFGFEASLPLAIGRDISNLGQGLPGVQASVVLFQSHTHVMVTLALDALHQSP